MSFVSDSAVSRVGPSSFTAEIAPGWDIFGVTNGGYLLAIAGRALIEEAGGRTLVSITGRYLNPARPGPIKVEVEVLKTGRSLSTLRAIVTDSDERPLVAVSASIGSFVTDSAPVVHGAPPNLPSPNECVLLVPAVDGPLPPPFSGMIECRLHPDDVAIGQHRPGPPIMRGWFRLRDGERLDPVGLVLTADGFPPAVFNSDLPLGWTPTVDLTVHVRRPGEYEWVACQFYCTRFISGGWLEEDGEIWHDGQLVAQSRQLALVSR